MRDEPRSMGYGYSLPGREDAWKDLCAERPRRGANCPLTLELLDLAFGQPFEAEREKELRLHVEACAYCGKRFAAQERAFHKLADVRADSENHTLAEIGSSFARRRAAARRGAVQLVRQAVGKDREECVAKMLLPPMPEGGLGALDVYLRWERPVDRGGDEPWYLKLELPGPGETDLEEYEGRSIDLLLSDASEQACWAIQTRLYRVDPGSSLYSHAQPVAIDDPRQVAGGLLTAGARTKRAGGTDLRG